MFGQNRHNHLISEKVESLNFGINFVIIYKEKKLSSRYNRQSTDYQVTKYIKYKCLKKALKVIIDSLFHFRKNT